MALPRLPFSDLANLRQEVADRRELLWANVKRFDQDCGNSWKLWEKLPVDVQDQYNESHALKDSDPEKSFTLAELSASNGNPTAMIAAALCCEYGDGTSKDREKARKFYEGAVEAGSWPATIYYARFLDRIGDQEMAFATLEDGVDADYTAAFFWLAWLLYKHESSRKMARQVFPMVERAADRAHPGGRWLKAKLLIKGQMGVVRIAEGWRIQRALSKELGDQLEEQGRSNFQ